jgi:hypothetical protein
MVDLLSLTSLVAFHTEILFFLLYKTICLNEEVNRTKPFPIVRVPWLKYLLQCVAYYNFKFITAVIGFIVHALNITSILI